MNFIAWIILGLVAGFIASKVVNRSGRGILTDIALGVVGAVVGGVVFNLLGMQGVTGLNIWSIIVSVVGAILVLVIYHRFLSHR